MNRPAKSTFKTDENYPGCLWALSLFQNVSKKAPVRSRAKAAPRTMAATPVSVRRAWADSADMEAA